VVLDISKGNSSFIIRIKHPLLGPIDPEDEGFIVLQNARNLSPNNTAKSQEN
jgi:hypothetical protein